MPGFSFGDILDRASNVPGNLVRGTVGLWNNGPANLSAAASNAGSAIANTADAAYQGAARMGGAINNTVGSLLTSPVQTLSNTANIIKDRGFNNDLSPGNIGSRMLQGAGLAIGAPEQALYKGGSRLVDNLTGSTSPDVQNFSDLLNRNGVDTTSVPGKALNLAGSTLTNPMTYLGAGPTNAALASAGKALAPAAKGAMSIAAPVAKTVMQSMEGAAPSSFAAMRNAANGLKVFRNVAPAGASDAAVTSQIGSPIMGRIPMGARQKIMVGSAGKATMSAAQGSPAAKQALLKRFAGVADELGGQGSEGVEAMYMPSLNAVGLRPGATPDLLRHELTHGIINNAAASGQTAGLPFMKRLTANLQRAAQQQTGTNLLEAKNPAMKSAPGALASILHEVNAYGSESRNLLGGISGAKNFLFDPRINNAYSQIFAQQGMNPAVQGMYSALPSLPKVAGVGTAAGVGLGSGGALYNALNR